MHHASMIQPTADDRATEFEAVEGTGEQFSGYTLLVEAYAAIWLILLVWLVFLWRKQADLAARVAGLEGALTRAEKRLAGAKSAPKAAAEEEPTA
ncbi:MAG: CcmD family protein [Labilithrix sp.]|nr:CcmD family protein [Labilithrix sp.]